ncbi:recombinase, phage RecT family protein [Paenibacillus dendritiformis]|uniref:RecT family recombinase n=1 Tax=Paenibacillus dendritiformis TaxID=130049 RepID=UPI001B13BB9E|nr:RecT family recombinase [Paenibacillus dendritiformis]GIO76258.1 recombinase, phage RecT family protein [Paenibacillus dendritiformis]
MNDYILKIQEALDQLLDAKHDALPSGFKKTRFSENCKAYIKDVKGIEKCNVDDVVQALFKGAVLGLDFLAKECHVIHELGVVKFQTDYKGEMTLVKRHSVRPILDIYAKNVREGDDFREEIREGIPLIHFNPVPFNNSPIVGTFAVALFLDGGMVYETMPAEEIEQIRQHYGKNPGSDSWEKSQGEMYKRTALRRLCKTIEIDFDAEQSLAYEAGSAYEFTRAPRPQQRSPFNPLEPEEGEVSHDDGTAETDEG